MKLAPLTLIDLIFKHSKKQRIPLPQMTRLVKLMYLTEVEYYRLKGERLTDLDWKFYHYGPYPPSLITIIGEPEIETYEWKKGKSSKQIVRDEEVFMGITADDDTERLVAGLVKEWGDADLNQLLDFVYFETEPMQGANRGDPLDFSVVKPLPTKRLRLQVDTARLAPLRKRLSERAKSYAALRQQSTPPTDLVENMEVWDAERGQYLPSGTCRINIDDLVPDE